MYMYFKNLYMWALVIKQNTENTLNGGVLLYYSNSFVFEILNVYII